MATFSPVGTGNAAAPGTWAGAGVPLPGSATQASGGVGAPPVTPITGGESFIPVEPLPGSSQGPVYGTTV
jgi:hypothetical protein